MGSVSQPFSVNLHMTFFGGTGSSILLTRPDASSSLNLLERRRGEIPSTDSRSWLKRSFFLMPMSLRISKVHFFPSTSNVAAMGQLVTGIAERGLLPSPEHP